MHLAFPPIARRQAQRDCIYIPLGRKYTCEASKEFGVSMPLHWAEVKKGLKISDFTFYNAVKRISKIGDIFIPVIKKGIDLKKVMKTLDNWQLNG